MNKSKHDLPRKRSPSVSVSSSAFSMLKKGQLIRNFEELFSYVPNCVINPGLTLSAYLAFAAVQVLYFPSFHGRREMDIKALLGSEPCKILTNCNFCESHLFDEKTLPRLCVKYFPL